MRVKLLKQSEAFNKQQSNLVLIKARKDRMKQCGFYSFLNCELLCLLFTYNIVITDSFILVSFSINQSGWGFSFVCSQFIVGRAVIECALADARPVHETVQVVVGGSPAYLLR